MCQFLPSFHLLSIPTKQSRKEKRAARGRGEQKEVSQLGDAMYMRMAASQPGKQLPQESLAREGKGKIEAPIGRE